MENNDNTFKVAVHSDLHMEFGEEFFVPVEQDYASVDAIVLAGDIHFAREAPRWIHENFGGFGKPIVYIAGNHEFYNGHWDKSLAFLRRECASKYPDIHFLEDDSWTHPNGVRFLGATLWTDFALGGHLSYSMHAARSRMNDYRKIGHGEGPDAICTEHVIRRHAGTSAYLVSALSTRPDGVVDVVVTHHAPHADSLFGDYVDNILTPCYASDMSKVMGDHKPQLWIHGHIHVPASYKLGETAVRSNPADYPKSRKEPVLPLILDVVLP